MVRSLLLNSTYIFYTIDNNQSIIWTFEEWGYGEYIFHMPAELDREFRSTDNLMQNNHIEFTTVTANDNHVENWSIVVATCGDLENAYCSWGLAVWEVKKAKG